MKRVCVACLLVAPFFSAPVSAETVSYQFTGIVTEVASALMGAFAIGEMLVGRFDVDTAGTQQHTRTIYEARNLTVSIGGDYVVTGTFGSMIVTDDAFLDGVTVYFSNSSAPTVFGEPVNNASPGYFDIQLDWFGNGPFSTQALPLVVPLDNAALDRSNLNFPSDNERLSYKVTSMSPVPGPAAIWLFATGLAGILGASRRRMEKPEVCR